MKKYLLLVVSLIIILTLSVAFAQPQPLTKSAEPTEKNQPIEKGSVGSISGEITRINKPDMTITVQNPTQGMEISVTARQIKGLEVGDRVMVKYHMKEGKAKAIRITKLPGMQNQPLSKPK
ncbi:MAG: hypothetical protein N2511_08495 [Thermodesulfovibrionales bacterium]|nr:hypothetical protein [Thermodesulfovibrionales bacterium]